MSGTIEFTNSSGNVFADLGLPDPEERLLKADLAFQIKQILDADGLTPEAAAARLHIGPTQLEDLRLGRHVQIQLAA